MKSAANLLKKAIEKRNERNYPFLYLVVDLHGTILTPSRATEFVSGDNNDKPFEVPCYIGVKDPEPYLYAYETLKLISRDFPWIKLILWTSGKTDETNKFVTKAYVEEGIKFYGINENKDFKGNSYADFSEKFCFDVLFDDKAGFDPKIDWLELYNFLNKLLKEKNTKEEKQIEQNDKI